MTTSEWIAAGALAVSILSFSVAFFALGWNVYRDVVLKPRVKVRFRVVTRYSRDEGRQGELLLIEATNHGPGGVKLTQLHGRYTRPRWWPLRRRKWPYFVIEYRNPHPASLMAGSDPARLLGATLPTQLQVGDEARYFLAWDANCCMKGDPVARIGVADTFGRKNWAPRADVREVSDRYRRDFS